MKLPKWAADAVQEAMTSQRREARYNFQEFIQQEVERDVQPAVENTREYRPELSDEELRLNVLFGWISDGMWGWCVRGVARRFYIGDVEEFALFLQMQVRQAALNHLANYDEYIDIWQLLPALAIRDDATVKLFMEVATYPLTSGHVDTRDIYNGVHAILRDDAKGMDAIARKKLSKSSPTWLTGIIRCLQGIVSEDARLVASGIDEHLVGYRRSYRGDPLEKVVSLHAHGLYRLAQTANSKLVADIDVARQLPWDAQLHEVASGRWETLRVDHFGECPRELAETFVTLKRPRWV